MRIQRDFLKRPVFEKIDGYWLDVLSTITKQYNYKIHPSAKLTPLQASLEKNEGYVYQSFIDKRKRTKPKYKTNDFVRVADLRKTISKEDSTNWLYKLYIFTEIIVDTIPGYKIDHSPERYKEASRKKNAVNIESKR